MYSYIHKSYRINRWTLKISQAEHRSSLLLAHDRKLFIYRCIFIFIYKYFPSLVFSSIHSILLFQGIYHLWLLSPITHINNTHPDTKIIHNYCVLFLVFFSFIFVLSRFRPQWIGLSSIHLYICCTGIIFVSFDFQNCLPQNIIHEISVQIVRKKKFCWYTVRLDLKFNEHRVCIWGSAFDFQICSIKYSPIFSCVVVSIFFIFRLLYLFFLLLHEIEPCSCVHDADHSLYTIISFISNELNDTGR